MTLVRNISKVFIANFAQLLSSLIIGFVIPAILSIPAYADLKTYTLYLGYVGFLQLGFHDGLYIKYGGKSESQIDIAILKGEHIFYVIFQLIVSIIFTVIAVYMKNLILFLLAISILPTNLMNFYKNYYQAIGNFKIFSRLMYINTICYLTLNIALAFIFHSRSFVAYCLITLLANVVVCLLSEYWFYKRNRNIKAHFNKQVMIQNIKVGFYIMLGSFSVMIFYALDRWFVMWFLNTSDFAYYSFAVSLLSMINILVNSITVTFYNYLAQGTDKKLLKNIKNFLMIIGFLASSCYFGCAMVLQLFLTKYIPALDIIAITFINLPFMIVINSIYVNLYKVNKQEKKYFKVVFTMVIVSFIFNFIAALFFHSSESIAFATVIAMFTWLLYSGYDFKYLMSNKKDITYILLLVAIFLISSHCLNWLTGLIIYILMYIALTLIFYKKLLRELMNRFKGIKK